MAKLTKICLAQIEVVPGEPQVNLKKVLNSIAKAKIDGAELIVFSELCIPGYVLGDMWERTSFIEECVACNEKIEAASKGICVIWGNVSFDKKLCGEDGRIRKYNAAYMAYNGAIIDIIPKILQPNYRLFDDDRHFYSQRKMVVDGYLEKSEDSIISFRSLLNDRFRSSLYFNDDINLGIMLCEDGWDTDYTMSPIQECCLGGANLIVNLSCSPYTHNKNSKRNRVFSEKAKKHGVPIIYVNNTGVQNNGKTVYTFDGNSCIYDREGNQWNPYNDFEEACETFEIDLEGSFGDPTYDEHDDIGMLHKSIVYGTKKMMEQLGIKKVVIGASGGVDSAVAAAIYSEILDPKDIYLVNMPSKFNSETTKNLALDLAENIGCNYDVIYISESAELTDRQFKEIGKELTSFNMENVQARDRSARILAAYASQVGGVFTCNANKTEMTVGYTTIYGDLGGWLAILADLWKGQVYDMAKYINESAGKEIIPQGTIDIVPSAELSAEQNIDEGKGDPIKYEYHDLLFKSWVERWDRATPENILDWYIQGMGKLEKELGWFNKASISLLFGYSPKKFVEDLERWWNCYDGLAVAKRIQSPPVLAVSKRAFGFDHRETQTKPHYTERYYKLKNKLLANKSDKR